MDIDPEWSPNGNFLAYSSDRNGDMQIWIRNLGTSEERLLLPDFEGISTMASWSPNGKKIAFFHRDELSSWGRLNLYVADVATGEFEQVDQNSIFFPSKPTWSPDGNVIGVMASDRYTMRYREGVNKFM